MDAALLAVAAKLASREVAGGGGGGGGSSLDLLRLQHVRSGRLVAADSRACAAASHTASAPSLAARAARPPWEWRGSLRWRGNLPSDAGLAAAGVRVLVRSQPAGIDTVAGSDGQAPARPGAKAAPKPNASAARRCQATEMTGRPRRVRRGVTLLWCWRRRQQPGRSRRGAAPARHLAELQARTRLGAAGAARRFVGDAAWTAAGKVGRAWPQQPSFAQQGHRRERTLYRTLGPRLPRRSRRQCHDIILDRI